MSTYKSHNVARTACRNRHINQMTAAKATQAYTRWQPVDDERVLKTLDIPTHEVAEALGRTMYAVAARRSFLLHGEPSNQ